MLPALGGPPHGRLSKKPGGVLSPCLLKTQARLNTIQEKRPGAHSLQRQMPSPLTGLELSSWDGLLPEGGRLILCRSVYQSVACVSTPAVLDTRPPSFHRASLLLYETHPLSCSPSTPAWCCVSC